MNSIAWRAVFDFLSSAKEIDFESIDDIAARIFRSTRNNAEKGHEIEYYLITRSILMNKLTIKEILTVTEFDYHSFSYNELAKDWFSTKPVVLVPIESNHPVNDVYIYVPGNDVPTLYGIQITIENDETNHYDDMIRYLDDPNAKFNQVLYKFSQCFEETPNYVQIFVIKGKSKPVDDYYCVSLTEMSNDYPALSDFYW